VAGAAQPNGATAAVGSVDVPWLKDQVASHDSAVLMCAVCRAWCTGQRQLGPYDLGTPFSNAKAVRMVVAHELLDNCVPAAEAPAP
jgi:hypothetical protein